MASHTLASALELFGYISRRATAFPKASHRFSIGLRSWELATGFPHQVITYDTRALCGHVLLSIRTNSEPIAHVRLNIWISSISLPSHITIKEKMEISMSTEGTPGHHQRSCASLSTDKNPLIV